MDVLWLSRPELIAEAHRRILPTDVVLDVGPGIRPQRHFRPKVHVCMEPYAPYITRHRRENRFATRFVYFNCTWDVGLKRLPSKSVDSVFALDVVEHLEKESALQLLREAERVARYQIVIFTPLGFYPQFYEDNMPDRWGMQGGFWQSHHSGWSSEDFGDGWEIIAAKEYHSIDQNNQPLDTPYGAIWAFRNLGRPQASSFANRMYFRWDSFQFWATQRLQKIFPDGEASKYK